jgi:hypothetical protein
MEVPFEILDLRHPLLFKAHHPPDLVVDAKLRSKIHPWQLSSYLSSD